MSTKFKVGDRIRSKLLSSEAVVTGVSFNSIKQEWEYYVIWDDRYSSQGHCYTTYDGDDMWEKIGQIRDAQVAGLDFAPADANDRLPTGTNDLGYPKLSDFSGRAECNHKWVEVGFNHAKTVCYHCDVEKK